MLLDIHDDVSDAAITPQDGRSRLTIGRLMVGIAIFAVILWLAAYYTAAFLLLGFAGIQAGTFVLTRPSTSRATRFTVRRITRFTVKKMMVAVAILALACGATVELLRRHWQFEKTARDHIEIFLVRASSEGFPPVPRSKIWNPRTAKTAWHLEMIKKYQEAACCPWLPVSPDPPEPE